MKFIQDIPRCYLRLGEKGRFVGATAEIEEMHWSKGRLEITWRTYPNVALNDGFSYVRPGIQDAPGVVNEHLIRLLDRDFMVIERHIVNQQGFLKTRAIKRVAGCNEGETA